jgi:hypothetical protein
MVYFENAFRWPFFHHIAHNIVRYLGDTNTCKWTHYFEVKESVMSRRQTLNLFQAFVLKDLNNYFYNKHSRN